MAYDKELMKKNAIYYAKYLVILAAISIFYQVWSSYDYQMIPLDNTQMSPQFQPDELHMGKRIEDYSTLYYGDVVYYEFPHRNIGQNQKGLSFGRIVGLPGDRIGFKEGKLYRNGKLVKEEIEQEFYGKDSLLEVMIPRDYVYIASDSRQRYINEIFLMDSRFLGPILMQTLVGKFKEE